VIQPAEGHRLNSGTLPEIKAGRGGRRPGAGRKPSRAKPTPSPAEGALRESLRACVNGFLAERQETTWDEVAAALTGVLARARALQREA
jgi:hypothetical protein